MKSSTNTKQLLTDASGNFRKKGTRPIDPFVKLP